MGRILTLVAVLTLSFVTASQASLWDRGGGLIYDNVLNITWLQDANYGAGSTYDDGAGDAGRMTWGNAVAWVNQLSYAGFTGWRLPDAYNRDSFGLHIGPNASGSELGHMYYNNLGGVSNDPVLLNPTFIDGNGNAVSFQYMQSYSYYWFRNEFDSIKLGYISSTLDTNSPTAKAITTLLGQYMTVTSEPPPSPFPARPCYLDQAWLWFGVGWPGIVGLKTIKRKQPRPNLR
jgi:hypothetical protein